MIMVSGGSGNLIAGWGESCAQRASTAMSEHRTPEGQSTPSKPSFGSNDRTVRMIWEQSIIQTSNYTTPLFSIAIKTVKMEEVDRVAARVSICALTGILGGTAYATLRGFPLANIAIKSGTSCAMVGTVLFGVERLAYLAMKEQIDNERRLVLTSHAFSGVMGGGINGYLYQKKPMRGMFYFIPVMLGVGFLDLMWQQKKQERIMQVAAENSDKRECDEQSP